MFGSGRCPFGLGSLVPNRSPMRRTSIFLLKDCLKVKSELKAAFCADLQPEIQQSGKLDERKPTGWGNRSYLWRFVGPSTLGLIWINFVHLFMVSLVPFATAWIARTRLACRRVATHRSLVVLASFMTAIVVAFVAPRVGFGLISAALVLHLRPDVSGSRR